jgi:hypothetical protein
MADSSSYQILLRASIDAESVRQQISAIGKNYVVKLNVQINAGDTKAIQAQIGVMQKQMTAPGKGLSLIDFKREMQSINALKLKMEEIRKTFSSASKISVVGGVGDGGVQAAGANVRYTDAANKTVAATMKLVQVEKEVNGEIVKGNELLVTSSRYVDDIAAREKKVTQEAANRNKELEKAVLYAEKFLERSKTLSGSRTGEAVDLANRIKAEAGKGVGANLGDIQKMGRELQVIDSGLKQSGASAWSFNEQLRVAFERTLQWASATQLVFGTIQQFKEGIAYITALNKEMTNIQVLQVDGAKSKEEIAGLSLEFNNLAKSLGATTLEVAKGKHDALLKSL